MEIIFSSHFLWEMESRKKKSVPFFKKWSLLSFSYCNYLFVHMVQDGFILAKCF